MNTELLGPYETEQKIGEIALQAASANLSLKTTKTMVQLQYAKEDWFVCEHLTAILETIENIFELLNRK